jgi:hypothetical protein
VQSDVPSSIATAARAVSLLAASATRNSRDIATALLRSCVVSKLTYLCRPARPDLLLAGARGCPAAHSDINCLDCRIHGTAATADQRLASVRVCLPSAMNGCGIRSAVTTSESAYVAAWRAVGLHRRRVIRRCLRGHEGPRTPGCASAACAG